MQTVSQILKNYKSYYKSARKMHFSGLGKFDVYNITAPVKIQNSTYILGRVEARDSEIGARTIFFKKKKNSDYWIPAENIPIFSLQDPFLTKIDDQIILGGVEIKQKSENHGLSYRTVFYKGSSPENLKIFSHGPWGMKDIRLTRLENGKFAVFTRPQGRKGGLGRIGFTILSSLSELTPRKLIQAGLIKEKFAKGNWGGVSEIHFLKNKKIGILGHIARFSKDKKIRFYYPIVFVFDPETGESTPVKIIARRAELPEGEAKRPDLYNIIFPGGLIRMPDKTIKLYAGVGDAEAYEITLDDPFIEYESEIKN